MRRNGHSQRKPVVRCADVDFRKRFAEDAFRSSIMLLLLFFGASVRAEGVSRLRRAQNESVVVAHERSAAFDEAEIDAVVHTFAIRWPGRVRALVVEPATLIDARTLHGDLGLLRDDCVVVVDRRDRLDVYAPRLGEQEMAAARRAGTRPGTTTKRLAEALTALTPHATQLPADLVDAARAAHTHEVEMALETVEVVRAYDARLELERARLLPELAAQGSAAISGFDEVTAARLRPLVVDTATRAHRRVWLVRSPDGIGPRSLLDLYVDGGLTDADLLVVTNGFVWAARRDDVGDAVDSAVLEALKAHPLLRPAVGPTVVTPAMFESRARAVFAAAMQRSFSSSAPSADTVGEPSPPPDAPELSERGSPSASVSDGTGIVVRVGGIIGLVVAVGAVRRRLLRTRREKFADELRTIEYLVTEVFLQIDQSAAGPRLSARAVELRERYDMLQRAKATSSTLALAGNTRLALQDIRRELQES
jgi:hypothetical protein